MGDRGDAVAAAWAAANAKPVQASTRKTPCEETVVSHESPEDIQRRIQEEDDRIYMTRMGKAKAKPQKRINNDAAGAWAAVFAAEEERQNARSLDPVATGGLGPAAPKTKSKYADCIAETGRNQSPQTGAGASQAWASAFAQEEDRQAARTLEGYRISGTSPQPQAPSSRVMAEARSNVGSYPAYANGSDDNYSSPPPSRQTHARAGDAHPGKVGVLKEQYRKFSNARITEQRRKCTDAVGGDPEVFDWVYRLLCESQKTSSRALNKQIGFLEANMDLDRDKVDLFLELIEFEEAL